MTYDWLTVQCALDGLAPPRRHVVITVNGTGSPDPFGFGFAGELGSQLDDELFFWQPVSYPAAVFPMGPSVQAGVDEVVRLIQLYPASDLWTGKIVLSGYSQGAMVTDIVWRDEILNPKGRLYNLAQSGAIEVIGIVNFGDPLRCPGICNGNLYAGFPLPAKVDGVTTGGISGPLDLTAAQTPAFLMSCNNDGDLYGAAPVGDTPWTQETGVGHDESIIFNIVQNFTMANVLAIVKEVLQILGMPLGGVNLQSLIQQALGIGAVPATGVTSVSHVVALVEALYNGGLFVVQSQGPHLDYEKFIPAMVNFVMDAGRKAQ